MRFYKTKDGIVAVPVSHQKYFEREFDFESYLDVSQPTQIASLRHPTRPYGSMDKKEVILYLDLLEKSYKSQIKKIKKCKLWCNEK